MDRGLHVQGKALLRRVLDIRQNALGAEHLDTLDVRYSLAVAEQDDHAGAEAEYREVLAAELRVLGPDDPTTLATRHEVARMMALRGDHAGAETEFREVLAARLRVLGPDHPSTRITAEWVDYYDRRRRDSDVTHSPF
jgi:hypothetical protein